MFSSGQVWEEDGDTEKLGKKSYQEMLIYNEIN